MPLAFSYLLCLVYALSIMIIVVSTQSPTPTDAQTVKGIPKSISNLTTAVRKHKRGIKNAVKDLKSKTKEPKRSSLIQGGDSSARDLKANLVAAMKIIGNIDGSANLTTVKQKWRDQVGVVNAKANGYLSEWYTFCKQQGLSCKEVDTSQSSSQDSKETDKSTSAKAGGSPSQPSKSAETNSAASNSVTSSNAKPINPAPKTSKKSLTAAPPSSPSSATPPSSPSSATPPDSPSSNPPDPKSQQQNSTKSAVDSTAQTAGPVLSLPNLKVDNSD